MTYINTLETEVSKGFGNRGTDPLLLHAKLEEINAPTKTFTPVRKNKGAYEKGWNRDNQHELHQIVDRGNTGLVCKEGIVAFDKDDIESEPQEITDWFLINSTLTIETGHKNQNPIYYCPNAPQITKEVFGKHNPSIGGLELNTQGSMVVVPGSTLDHSTCSKRKPCEGFGQTQYKWTDPYESIRVLSDEEYRTLLNLIKDAYGYGHTASKSPSQSTQSTGEGKATYLPNSRKNLTDGERRWLDGALNNSVLANERQWAIASQTESGENPGDFGLKEILTRTDKSFIEADMSKSLYFSFGDFPDCHVIVSSIMDEWAPPKWTHADSYYQNSILSYGYRQTVDKGKYYRFEESDSRKDESRTSVLRVWADVVILSVDMDFEVGDRLTARQVRELSRTDHLSVEQTRKVLKDLTEIGVLSSIEGVGYQKISDLPSVDIWQQFSHDRYQLADLDDLYDQRSEFLTIDD